jgi:hypothetical protein
LVELLQQYDITIRYKSDKTNNLADLLSGDIASAQLSVLHLSGDLSDFSNWPLYVPQALEQGLDSVSEDVRHLLEGELMNFRFDEEVGVLYRTSAGTEAAFLPFEVRADWVHRWHAGHSHLGWEEIYRQA